MVLALLNLALTQYLVAPCQHYQQESPADARVARESAAIRQTGNSAIRSADPVNTSIEPNM